MNVRQWFRSAFTFERDRSNVSDKSHLATTESYALRRFIEDKGPVKGGIRDGNLPRETNTPIRHDRRRGDRRRSNGPIQAPPH